MQDDNLSREELLAQSVELRRRVEELEAENFRLSEQRSTGDEAPPGKASDKIDDLPLPVSPEFREIEDHYRAVVESSSEAICITQDGVLKYANSAGSQLTGYSREELLSRPFAALTHPEDLEELARIYMMRLRGEYVPPGHRFRIIAKDGELKWVESWSASIEWKGRPAVLSMIRDVTRQVHEEEGLLSSHLELERRVEERTAELQAINDRLLLEVRERERAELSVRESEERFQRLMEHSPMGIAVTGMKGEVEYLNKKFIQLFGYTLKDIPTLEHWWYLAYPDPQHGDRVKSEWLSATREAGEKGTEAEPVEREVRCKDGKIRVIDFRKTVLDKWVIHTFHDVTDNRRQEEALLESEQMFRLLSEQSLISVAILQDGIYRYANQTMSALCEYSLEEIFSWGPEEFLAVVHPADRALVMEQARMKQRGDARQKVHYEFRIITKSGITKFVEIYSKTIQFKGSPANLMSMLDLTERKKAEEARSETENRYRSLVETSPDPIILYDLAGNLITVNQQAATAYGVESPEQLLAEIKSVSDILDEEGQEKAADNFKRTLATGSSRKSEYTIIRKDGSAFPVEINSSMIRNADGEPAAFISVVRDITERKRVEQRIRESEERLRLAWDTIPDALSISRLQDGTYVDVNNGYTSLTGYTRGEVVGKSALNLPFWDDLRERQSFAAALTQHGHVRNYETRLRRKDGETRTILISASLLMLDRENHVLSVIKDIEDLIRTQEALSETEARYKRLVETTDTGFVELDSLGKVLQANDPYVRMAGASKVQEIIGRSVLDWTAPECLLENDAAVQLCLRQGHISDFETTYLRADGSRVRILIDATTEDSPEGRKIVTLCRDITERKLVEEALKLSELTYREIFDTVNDTIWIHDIETFKFVDVNNNVLEMFGYSVEEALDLGVEEISSGVPPFIQATAVDFLRKAAAGEPQLFEWHSRHKDGHLFWTEVNLKRGTVAGKECILAIERDITERKRTEEALRAKTEELDLFFTAALDLLCIADTDGYFRRLNPEWQTVLGYPLAELEGRRFLDFVHPEDLEATLAAVSQLAGQEIVLNFTNRYRCQDGSYRWIEWRSYPAGKLIYAAGRDITERRCAEELTRENLTRLQTMVRNTPIVLYGVDRCGVFTLSEGKGLLGMGLKPGEIVGRSAFDVYRDRPDILENFRRALAGEAFTAPMKAGNHVYDAYHEPVFGEDGEYAGTLGVLVDVTERKQAERAVRESEERLRLAWETSPDCFSISRLTDGVVVQVNAGFTKLTGYTSDEVIGRSSLDFHLWADPDDRTELISDLTLDGEVRGFETKFRRKDGEIRTVEISAGIMTLEGEPHFLAIMKDIEDSKQAQAALARSEELFRKYFELGLVGMALTSPEKGWVHVNDRICEMLGYTRDELLQTTWTALTHPEDLEPDLAQFNRMLAGEIEGYSLDKRFIRKDGELVYTTLHVSCIRKADGTVEHVIANLHDITDRKRAEVALRKSEQLLRQVLDTIPVRLFWKDTESVYLGCNRLFALDSGLQSQEELVGKTDFDMVWEEEALQYRADDRQVMESVKPKVSYEATKTTPEGHQLWVRTSKVPLLDPDGRIKGVLGTYEDITERKCSEEALRSSEERYASVIAATQDGIFDWDLVRGSGYVSERWQEIYGLSGTNIPSIDVWKRWVHPDDLARVEQRIRDLLAGRTPLGEVEHRIRDAHGHEKWVLARAKAHFDAQGHAIRMVGTLTDITERKKAQLALHASEERYRAFVANSAEGIWRFELDPPVPTTLPIEEQIEQILQRAYLAECNDATARMYGLNCAEDLIGVRWKDLAGDDPRNIELIRAFIQSGYRLVETESFETDRDGNVRRFMNSTVGLLENAHMVRAWGVQRDITEQKLAEEALREANLVVERSPVVLFRWRATEGWPVAIVSKNVIQFGYTHEELLSGAVTFASMVHPQDLDRVFQEVQEYSASGAVRFQQEYRIITKGGEVRWVDDRTVVERDDDGQIVFYQGTVVDITERKKVEERLQEKETLLESILDASPVGINYVRNRQMLWSNSAWEKMFGFEHPNEYVGRSARILYQSDEDYESAGEAFNRAITHDIATEFDATLRKTDGSVFSGNVRVRLMKESHPDNFEAVVAVSDISNRKKAEEALKTSRHRLDQIIEFLPDPTVVIDDKGKVEAWNRAMEHLTGVAAESILGKGDFEHALPFYGVRRPILADLALKWDERYLDQYISIARREHGLLTSESYHPMLKGGLFLSGTARSLYDSTGQPVGAIESLRDVTEIRKGNEENLRLKKYVENIINSMPSMLVGVDRECRVTQWNSAAENLTGVSADEARGKMLSDIMPMLSQQLAKVRQAMVDRTVQSDHKVPRTTESGTRYEDITVFPLASNGVEGAVIRVDEVTERVRIEEMMIQTEKMMSVGGLAAGMAHEVNNPLGVIMQATQNVLRRLSPALPVNVRVAEECGLPLEALANYLDRREIVTFLKDIRSSGQRAADVVSNMLSFSRKSEKGGSSESLSELLDRTLVLAGSDYDLKKKYDFRQIEIVREYDPSAPNVVCQAGKIQQVFLNILRNGAEAMQETWAMGSVPQFTLRVSSEGKMVRVEIEDNGPGMEESIRRRVFEPFFTTKPPGVGTGLGMSVSYFIISDDHGGTMEVESSPGNGTRLIIRLPVQGRTS